MRQICPHCNYARQATDTAPDWQCPRCEKAYAKAGSPLPPESLRQYGPAVGAEGRRSTGRWLVALAVLGAVMLFSRPLWHHRSTPALADASAGQPEVVLYATAWCGYCKATRQLFEANGIRYTEYDIEKDSAALSEHRKLGGHGVPLIVVGDEVVKGYDEQTLRRLLGPWLKD